MSKRASIFSTPAFLLPVVLFVVVVPVGSTIVLQKRGQSEAMDAAVHYINASPSAALLNGAGVGACAVDAAAKAHGVWPWQAQAAGKRIALHCFDSFASKVDSEPDRSPVRVALAKAREAIMEAP